MSRRAQFTASLGWCICLPFSIVTYATLKSCPAAHENVHKDTDNFVTVYMSC